MRSLQVLLVALAGALAFQPPPAVKQHEPWYTKADPAKRPFATRKDTTITLRPSGATFRIPRAWVEWHDQFGNNLHLTRAQLDAVARGDAEWDTEYASVTNAVLPFDRCCAHVGDDGWGLRSVSFGDLQVRVYDLDDTPETVERRINAEGVADVKRFTGKAPVIKQDLKLGWRRTVLSSDRYYVDYGATANVEFRVRRLGKRICVFVLMYANAPSRPEKAIASILDSFLTH